MNLDNLKTMFADKRQPTRTGAYGSALVGGAPGAAIYGGAKQGPAGAAKGALGQVGGSLVGAAGGGAAGIALGVLLSILLKGRVGSRGLVNAFPVDYPGSLISKRQIGGILGGLGGAVAGSAAGSGEGTYRALRKQSEDAYLAGFAQKCAELGLSKEAQANATSELLRLAANAVRTRAIPAARGAGRAVGRTAGRVAGPGGRAATGAGRAARSAGGAASGAAAGAAATAARPAALPPPLPGKGLYGALGSGVAALRRGMGTATNPAMWRSIMQRGGTNSRNFSAGASAGLADLLKALRGNTAGIAGPAGQLGWGRAGYYAPVGSIPLAGLGALAAKQPGDTDPYGLFAR